MSNVIEPDRQQTICSSCLVAGHTRRNCPNTERILNRCGYCHLPGHNRRGCRNLILDELSGIFENNANANIIVNENQVITPPVVEPIVAPVRVTNCSYCRMSGHSINSCTHEHINTTRGGILKIYIRAIRADLIFNIYTEHCTYFSILENLRIVDMRVLCFTFGIFRNMAKIDYLTILDAKFRELAWTSFIHQNINEIMSERQIYIQECNVRRATLFQSLQEIRNSNIINNINTSFNNLREERMTFLNIRNSMYTSVDNINIALNQLNVSQNNNRYVEERNFAQRILDDFINFLKRSARAPSVATHTQQIRTPSTSITHTKTYLKQLTIEMVENDVDTDPCDCTICFDAFHPSDIIHTNCNHMMCIDCVSGYSESIKNMTRKPNCPTCRADFTKFKTHNQFTKNQLTQIIENL